MSAKNEIVYLLHSKSCISFTVVSPALYTVHQSLNTFKTNVTMRANIYYALW